MKPFVTDTRAIATAVMAVALFATPSVAQVVINELHYHPEDPNGNAEFVELHNSGGAPVEISGWTLSGFAAGTFTFPGSTTIGAGGYVVVANDAALLQTLTGFSTPHQWSTGNLSNGGETVTLTDALAVEVDSVSYDDAPPWPTGPDGDGPSLELINDAFDNASALVWGASSVDNGTPGAQNSVFSESPMVLGESPARLSIVDTLTTVSVTFSEPVQNVSASDLSVNGSAATSVSGSGAGPYDFSGFAAPTTAPIAVGLAAGTIQDLEANAFGGTSWLYPNVVINELHYHPADPNGDAEFVELLNAGTIAADISGWLLDFGPVAFQFPAATTIPAGGATVVAMNPALLQSLTGYLAPHQWVAGALSNGGELVTLSAGLGVEIDRVDYGDQNSPPWPAAPDGGGPSLELIHASLDNTLPLSWRASVGANGTPGATNTVFDPGPIVIAESPARGAFIGAGLTQVSVTFHKDVTGVVAGDLIIDGAPATTVSGSGAGPYVFTVPAPTSDQVVVTIGPGAIRDLALNPFAGDSWRYLLALPDVVINEIHYHPADAAVGVGEDPERLQFLELYNNGFSPVDLTGWRLTDGVSFDFPVGASIAAGEYILVAKDGVFLDATVLTIPVGTQIFDWDGGDLENAGEVVRLTDPFGNTIDSVEYNDEGVWSALADGTGPSLELINPYLLNEFAASWNASSGANGTPGQLNTLFNINPAPVIADVSHDPPIPVGGASVTITARAFDASPFPIGSVQVCRRQDQDPTVGYACVAMLDNGLNGDGAASDGVYGAILPGLADGQRMDFAIAASAGGGLTISPRGHDCGLVPGSVNCAGVYPSQVYLIKFSNAAIPTDFPSYHMITTQHVRNLQNVENTTEYDATWVQCDTTGSCRVFYNVIEHYRGASSLVQHPHSFAVSFPDEPLPSEMGFPIRRLILAAQQPARQELGYSMFDATGDPTPERQFVRLNTSPLSHGGTQDWVYINVERYDEDYFASQNGAIAPPRFPDVCEVSGAPCTGDFECPAGEACVPSSTGNCYRGRHDVGARLYFEGFDPDAYRVNSSERDGYQKCTNEAEDFWTDLINLTDALTCSTTDGGLLCAENNYDGVYPGLVPQHAVVEEWGRWFAMHMVLNNVEGGIYRDTGDDYFLYFWPSLDHATFLPWDMDAIMAAGLETIWRTNVETVQRVIRHDAFAGHFVGAICDYMDTIFTQAEMDARIDALPDVLFPTGVPQGNGPQTKQAMKDWVAARRTYIANEISRETTLAGVPVSPYADANPVIALSGRLNQCHAYQVLVNGIPADNYTIANPGGVGANWSTSFTLVPGVNNIVVQTVDHDGIVIDSVSDAVIYSPPGSGGAPTSLKVTMPTRMVNTKTLTLRADILDSLGEIHWQTWTEVGIVSARRVSDQTPVATSVTVFETRNAGTGAGGPGEDEIRFYNGVGNVSITLDDPVSVAGEDIEIRVSVLGLTGSKVVTVLDENQSGLFTPVSGALSGAVTWGPSDGVIHLTGNVTVGSGATLTIDPGTLVMIDAGPADNGTGVFLSGGGSIQANGTEAEPIMLFPTSGAAALVLPQTQQNNYSAWRGVVHQGSGSSTYSYVFLVGAGNGPTGSHPRSGVLRVEDTHAIQMNDCVVADSPGKGLFVLGNNNVTLRRNSWSRIGYGGECLGGGHTLLIEDSWFTRIGYGPEAADLDGDILHLDNASSSQTIRRSVLADCGDDMIDHSGANPVVEDTLIWDADDKCVSLSGGGSVTFNNVLVFGMPLGVNGAGGILTHVTIDVSGTPMGAPISVNDSIVWPQGMSTGACNGNINHTLAGSTAHLACGTGNLSANPLFQDPGNYDYSLQAGSPAANAGSTGGRIGWLGFPDGDVCVNDGDCDDGNACTLDACDAGACVFTPIVGCVPCVGNGECDDGDPCTVDTCGAGLCSSAPGNDGASCDDGWNCTANDVCASGACAGTESCPVGQTCDALGQCSVLPTSLVFRDDGVYASTQDTFVRQAAPTTVHGALQVWEWDGEDPAPNPNVGLIRFDDIVGTGPGVIPTGATVTSATLALVVFDPSANAPGSVHGALLDWDEATTTWENLGPTGGASAGEDYAAVSAGDAPVSNGIWNLDITGIVQAWVNDPASNFGLVFVPAAGSTDGVQVRSSEYTTLADRPALSVEFHLAGCDDDGDCNDGLACNGMETCDLGTSLCLAGVPVVCDDGVGCTGDSCVEPTGTCNFVPDDGLCDDGSFCNGSETCDTLTDCQAGTPVDCGARPCSDALSQCVDCLSDLDCGLGEVCNVGAGTCAPASQAAPLPIVIGDAFTYFKGTAEPSPGGGGEATTGWAQTSFDDSSWLSGASGFAYGTGAHEASDPDTNTVLSDMSGNYVSVYFRREFHVDEPLAVDTMSLTVDYDDAFVAYVNGVEVLRTGLLLGLGDPPAFNQLANAGGGTNHEGDTTEVFDFAAAIPHLVAGTNVLSFQLHNVTLASSDGVLRPIVTATFISPGCTANIDCDDNLVCNGVETCNLSTNLCESGTPVDCDDGVECTVDACNEGTDTCDNTPSDAICDDSNVCTDNTCDALLGCQSVNNTAPCSDGDLCTENDVCSGGACQSGSTLDCDDAIGCTTDTCNSGTGCLNVDNCTGGDVCNLTSGVCEAPASLQPGDVIISGFSAHPEPEWIELFNTTSQPILLDAMTLVTRLDIGTGDGTVEVEWTLGASPAGLVIPAHGFFLVGESGLSPAPDLVDALDLATGESGTDERAISIELVIGGTHQDYVLYGRHDGSTPAGELPPGDVAFDGVSWPRTEVVRTVTGTLPIASFAEGPTQRLSAEDLYAGHTVEGFYSDEDTLGDGYTPGVWTSAHSTAGPGTPRNSGTPAVLPPSIECVDDIDCDDLQFCNGAETCNLSTDLCEAGAPPDCDDAVACTADSCNETTDSCDHGLCSMTVASVGGRYLAITPPTGLPAVSLRVDSATVSCLPQYVDENGLLGPTPVFRTSAEWGTIFVGDREVLPSTTYEVSAEVAGPQTIGQDSATTWLWGDANNVDGAELFDILCVQDGFSGIFNACTLEGDDVRAGIPDRTVDVDDLMAVLDGAALLPYPDADPCTGPPPSAPTQILGDPFQKLPRYPTLSGGSGQETPGSTNLITLVPSATRIRSGQQVSVDVFVRETSHLRGYQVALEVVGGSQGLLLTEDAVIGAGREDFAFAGRGSFRVGDVQGARLGAALAEGAVESYEPIYLGTFVFRATDTAKGEFVIRFVEERTFLRDDFSEPIARQLGADVTIRAVRFMKPPVVPSGPTDPVDGPADEGAGGGDSAGGDSVGQSGGSRK